MTVKTNPNAADEDYIKQREKELELARLQLDADIKDIMGTPAGVRFMRWIILEGGIFSTSMTGNSWTYFNEGARNFANKIFAKICDIAPEKVKSIILNEKGE